MSKEDKAINLARSVHNNVTYADIEIHYAEPNIRLVMNRSAEIKKVIFNDPATIVFWQDGTKTVVEKRYGDCDKEFDKEKGLAMAIAKKFFGNRGSYYNVFKEWCY